MATYNQSIVDRGDGDSRWLKGMYRRNCNVPSKERRIVVVDQSDTPIDRFEERRQRWETIKNSVSHESQSPSPVGWQLSPTPGCQKLTPKGCRIRRSKPRDVLPVTPESGNTSESTRANEGTSASTVESIDLASSCTSLSGAANSRDQSTTSPGHSSYTPTPRPSPKFVPQHQPTSSVFEGGPSQQSAYTSPVSRLNSAVIGVKQRHPGDVVLPHFTKPSEIEENNQDFISFAETSGSESPQAATSSSESPNHNVTSQTSLTAQVDIFTSLEAALDLSADLKPQQQQQQQQHSAEPNPSCLLSIDGLSQANSLYHNTHNNGLHAQSTTACDFSRSEGLVASSLQEHVPSSNVLVMIEPQQQNSSSSNHRTLMAVEDMDEKRDRGALHRSTITPKSAKRHDDASSSGQATQSKSNERHIGTNSNQVSASVTPEHSKQQRYDQTNERSSSNATTQANSLNRPSLSASSQSAAHSKPLCTSGSNGTTKSPAVSSATWHSPAEPPLAARSKPGTPLKAAVGSTRKAILGTGSTFFDNVLVREREARAPLPRATNRSRAAAQETIDLTQDSDDVVLEGKPQSLKQPVGIREAKRLADGSDDATDRDAEAAKREKQTKIPKAREAQMHQATSRNGQVASGQATPSALDTIKATAPSFARLEEKPANATNQALNQKRHFSSHRKDEDIGRHEKRRRIDSGAQPDHKAANARLSANRNLVSTGRTAFLHDDSDSDDGCPSKAIRDWNGVGLGSQTGIAFGPHSKGTTVDNWRAELNIPIIRNVHMTAEKLKEKEEDHQDQKVADLKHPRYFECASETTRSLDETTSSTNDDSEVSSSSSGVSLGSPPRANDVRPTGSNDDGEHLLKNTQLPVPSRADGLGENVYYPRFPGLNSANRHLFKTERPTKQKPAPNTTGSGTANEGGPNCISVSGWKIATSLIPANILKAGEKARPAKETPQHADGLVNHSLDVNKDEDSAWKDLQKALDTSESEPKETSKKSEQPLGALSADSIEVIRRKTQRELIDVEERRALKAQRETEERQKARRREDASTDSIVRRFDATRRKDQEKTQLMGLRALPPSKAFTHSLTECPKDYSCFRTVNPPTLPPKFTADQIYELAIKIYEWRQEGMPFPNILQKWIEITGKEKKEGAIRDWYSRLSKALEEGSQPERKPGRPRLSQSDDRKATAHDPRRLIEHGDHDHDHGQVELENFGESNPLPTPASSQQRCRGLPKIGGGKDVNLMNQFYEEMYPRKKTPADEDSEPEIEAEVDVLGVARRMPSPITEADLPYWTYLVQRKEWQSTENEDHQEWINCHGPYASIHRAELAGSKEIVARRDPDVYDNPTHIDHFTMTRDNETRLVTWRASSRSLNVAVRMIRQLQLSEHGIPAETKVGWLPKTIFEIEWEDEEQEYQVNELYTTLDLANKVAGDLLIDKTTDASSSRIDDVKQRIDLQNQIREALEDLEKNNETFEGEDDDGSVKVRVKKRQLVGPRNF
ncbi:MAG: hypothetical protein M1820_001835 [Bogoriella megaspora]|nr:MAG: hypothetical protein M1820_001835 [Bogoriella megaspora]